MYSDDCDGPMISAPELRIGIGKAMDNTPSPYDNDLSSSCSSAGGYMDITEMITEELPISLPKHRNQIRLLKINREQCVNNIDVID